MMFEMWKPLERIAGALRAKTGPNRLPMPSNLPNNNLLGGNGGFEFSHDAGGFSYMFGENGNGAANIPLDADGRINWNQTLSDPTHNSAVWACLNSILTMWPEAEPIVERKPQGKEWQKVEGHPLVGLLNRPSAMINGTLFMQKCFRDLYGMGRGNAYSYVIFGLDGTPSELQTLYAPLTNPEGTETELISRYAYRPKANSDPIFLDPRRVIHWRNGLDPLNPRKGFNPLIPVFAEIATDNEAIGTQYKILRRGAVSWVIAPKETKDGGLVDMTDQDAAYILEKVQEKARAMAGLVMTGPFDFHKVGLTPSEMVIGETQVTAEERICAAFNLPPIVAGLHAGLIRSTFANYEQARAAAWEDCIIPLQNGFADEVGAKLLPLYQPLDHEKYRLRFDRSQVRCLMDDQKAKVEMDVALYQAGIIDRAEAMRRLNMAVAETADVTHTGVYYSGGKNAPGTAGTAAGGVAA